MNLSLNLNLITEENLTHPTERKDAAANRQAIMETARQLFAQHGVAHVTMADIAKEANVGKGTLYRRFAHKAELCLALLDNELQSFQNSTLVHLRQMNMAGAPYMAQLDYFLAELVGFTVSNLPLLCEIAASPMPPADLVQDVNQPHYWQELTVRGLLQRAAQAGEIDAEGLDVAYLASWLMSALNARTLRWQLEAQQFTAVRISDSLRQIVRRLGR
jgi:AcrR family transcriptional regulator